MIYKHTERLLCCSRVLDKPVDDDVYVHRILTGDHVATNFTILYQFQSTENKKGSELQLKYHAESRMTSRQMKKIELTVDQPMPALKALLTCQFCCQGQAKESQLKTVSSADHAIHFSLLGHYLCQQHPQHICN